MKKRSRRLTKSEMSVLMIFMVCLVAAFTVTAVRVGKNTAEEEPEQFVRLEGAKDRTEEGDPAAEAESAQTAGEQVVNPGLSAPFNGEAEKEQMDLVAIEDQLGLIPYYGDPVEVAEGDLAAENAEAAEGSADGGAEASADEGEEAAAATAEETSVSGTTANVQLKTLNFRPEDGLSWPVNGNVVLDYSMERTIFFPTLEQYKYNPGLVISQEEGTPVLAAADGKVVSAETGEELGTIVKMDLGNGYAAFYGQLTELSVSEGDVVSRGDCIGLVSAPTKYYSVEGSNLYFGLEKDGAPVDPLDYMK